MRWGQRTEGVGDLILLFLNYTVNMGNSVTVLAGYQSTELVKIISVSGDLMSVAKKFHRCFLQLFGNVSTFGMTCLGEPSGKESIHKGVN